MRHHLPQFLNECAGNLFFVSETRNAKFTTKSMMNRFNVDKAHVVPAQGQSGGLWLLNRNVDLEVVAAATTLRCFMCSSEKPEEVCFNLYVWWSPSSPNH
jgi:hypothetical protein